MSDCGLDFALQQIANLFIEDLGRRRVAHVVALGVILCGIHMGGNDALLLDPKPVNIILEAQAGREERWQAESVVVAGYSAVHPPVPVGHCGAEIDQHVHFVQVVQARLAFVFEEHIHEVDGIDVVRA